MINLGGTAPYTPTPLWLFVIAIIATAVLAGASSLVSTLNTKAVRFTLTVLVMGFLGGLILWGGA